MSVQMKVSQNDNRLYSPDRDIAHNFKFVVTKVGDMLTDEHWPALTKLLKDHGVTTDQLGDAHRAYIIYVATTAQHPKEKIQHALQRSGWADVPEIVKIAHQAYIGLIMTGMWYYAARDASLGADTSVDAKTLVEEGDRIARLMRQSWWRRKLSSLKKQIRSLGYIINTEAF
jgi:hypothetical protein